MAVGASSFFPLMRLDLRAFPLLAAGHQSSTNV
jgi:hypothetical protein